MSGGRTFIGQSRKVIDVKRVPLVLQEEIMSNDVNRADVTVDLRDVYKKNITDEVEFTFYNQAAHSLSQRFNVKLTGKPVKIPGVPAAPTGLAEVFIKPARYRYKSIFINVVGGEDNSIKEDFFVDPDAARPTQMDFQDLPAKSYGSQLLRILDAAKIDETKWNGLDKRNRATVLNLCRKMAKETTIDGKALITQVNGIDKTWLDLGHRERIFSPVHPGLLDALRRFPKNYKDVSGALHHFPNNWIPVAEHNSFKSRDKAGNIQLTLATDAGGANFFADIDLDDHEGIQHAADYLKHKITGKDTDPYDIHEILIYFQNLDPEYRLV